jgi:hypothetical protein
LQQYKYNSAIPLASAKGMTTIAFIVCPRENEERAIKGINDLIMVKEHEEKFYL